MSCSTSWTPWLPATNGGGGHGSVPCYAGDHRNGTREAVRPIAGPPRPRRLYAPQILIVDLRGAPAALVRVRCPHGPFLATDACRDLGQDARGQAQSRTGGGWWQQRRPLVC